MASQFSFSVMPSVSISRSKFNRKSQHKTSFNLGQIIPIYCDEVLPGDTRSLDVASLIRMSTPIAPIMDNIYMDLFAFFVPNRIVWEHWKEFMGENNTSAGIPSSTYTIPALSGGSNPNPQFQVKSYADYFGLPVATNLSLSTYDKISALPFRGLAKIYNRFFRDENLIAPLPVLTTDNNGVLVGESSNGSQFAYDASKVLVAAKLPDYFTTALPYAQKGGAVSIPLGTTAGVIVPGGTASTYYSDILVDANKKALAYTGQGSGALSGGQLMVDLSTATAATINQLRYAFQLQKFLEKDALYGTRYWEILAAHFGVTAPDASLQDPEYLGGKRININIDQVLSTAGYDASTSQEVGAPGANSVTAHKGSLFTKSFVEHGYIIVVAVARHDCTYGQGINRMWTRQTRYDFYWPVFANLGAQEIKNKEIYVQGSIADNGTFGYTSAWNEYRYKPSIVSGLLRPYVTGALPFWTLSERFSGLPTLGQTFIEQGRGNIKDALVTGTSGPDFIADFYFLDVAVRPMPVYSIPGLIDHH